MRPSILFSNAIFVLMTAASAGGLFWDSLYERDVPLLRAQVRGQDLVTLFLVGPILVAANHLRRSGSIRAHLVWLGTLAYVLYTYATLSVGVSFNPFFLVYVTLFCLSLFTFIFGLIETDATAVRRDFDRGTSRRPMAFFAGGFTSMMGLLWLAQIVPAIAEGYIPPAIAQMGWPTGVIYAFDLGFVVPGSCLAAYWFWKDEPRGYVLIAIFLVKGSMMGMALLSMWAFVAAAALPTDAGLLSMWVVLSVMSSAMLASFLRSL